MENISNELFVAKEYFVVQSSDLTDFCERVNSFIKNGWQLQGGICAVGGGSTGTGYAYYFQAMSK